MTKKPPKFSDLSEQYRQMVYAYFVTRVRNRDFAEDLTQDTFVKAWRYYPPKNTESMKPWFFAIARNILRDHYRHTKVVEKHREHLKYEVRSQGETSLDNPSENVQECINSLDPESKEILILKEIDGFTIEEIMEHLKMTRDRVRYRLKKAREKFVQSYNRSGIV